jgi:hypothetical protein
MYKALNLETNEEIIILHPRWKGGSAVLKQLDLADHLVCQGCLQPVRVKWGERKRPHFAHKHLKACSYGTESLEILSGRAVLYEWLEKQFGDAVTVEKAFPENIFPRPVDCWVDTEVGTFAYWIIENGIKLEPRESILAEAARTQIPFHWIFLQQMLREEKKEFHSLLLTPTERAFLQTTEYDQGEVGLDGEAGCSISYLDVEKGAITTYRNLVLFHKPNWYKGTRRVSPLDSVRVNRRTGEITHPGEMDRLVKSRRRQLRRSSKLKEYLETEAGKGNTAAKEPVSPPSWGGKDLSGYLPAPELPCVICGQITNNYWSTFVNEAGRKLCRCRECLERDIGSNQSSSG